MKKLRSCFFPLSLLCRYSNGLQKTIISCLAPLIVINYAAHDALSGKNTFKFGTIASSVALGKIYKIMSHRKIPFYSAAIATGAISPSRKASSQSTINNVNIAYPSMCRFHFFFLRLGYAIFLFHPSIATKINLPQHEKFRAQAVEKCALRKRKFGYLMREKKRKRENLPSHPSITQIFNTQPTPLL